MLAGKPGFPRIWRVQGELQNNDLQQVGQCSKHDETAAMLHCHVMIHDKRPAKQPREDTNSQKSRGGALTCLPSTQADTSLVPLRSSAWRGSSDGYLQGHERILVFL